MVAAVPDPGRTYLWSCRAAPANDVLIGAAALFNRGATPIDITRVSAEYMDFLTNPTTEPHMVMRVERVTSWSTFAANFARNVTILDTSGSSLPSTIGWYLGLEIGGASGSSRLRNTFAVGISDPATSSGLANRLLPRLNSFLEARGSTLQPFTLNEGEGLVLRMPSTLVDLWPIGFRVGVVVVDGNGRAHTLTALATYDVKAFGMDQPFAVFVNPSGSGATLQIVKMWISDTRAPSTATTRSSYQRLAMIRDINYLDGDAVDVTSSIVPMDPAAPTPPVLALRGPFDPEFIGEDMGYVAADFGASTPVVGTLKSMLALPQMMEVDNVPIIFPRVDRGGVIYRSTRRRDCAPIRLQPGTGLALLRGSIGAEGTATMESLAGFEVEFTVTRPRRFGGVRGVVEGVPT